MTSKIATTKKKKMWTSGDFYRRLLVSERNWQEWILRPLLTPRLPVATIEVVVDVIAEVVVVVIVVATAAAAAVQLWVAEVVRGPKWTKIRRPRAITAASAAAQVSVARSR